MQLRSNVGQHVDQDRNDRIPLLFPRSAGRQIADLSVKFDA
ncbi:MAG: hypothetical protein ACI8RE_000222 [Ilumatobacter sp.]|jgi:hypothetical protein|tara:strand:+ start:714 stop:836 length:123 start_codon:yes stop_codon:yes gene_type:complete